MTGVTSRQGRAAGQWVAFEPRDTLLVRDGRQFDAGTDAMAEPTLPGPGTVAGAVHAAYGADPKVVRGPLFARRTGDEWETFLPVPLDVVCPDSDSPTAYRLRPEPGGDIVTDLSDQCPQWLVGDGEPVGGWCRGEVIEGYLAGTLFEASGSDLCVEREVIGVVSDAELLVREPRVGLARDNDRAAREGLLYQPTHLRPADGVMVLAECEQVPGLPRGPTPLGGRGRLADVSVATGVGWPERPDVFPHGRVLVYVATPAIWRTGWRLPPIDGAELVAAAVAPAQPVATASPRDGMAATRALRWAVPAGSVYLLAFGHDGDCEAAGSLGAPCPDGGCGAAGRAAAWAGRVHGTAWGMDYGRDRGDKLVTAGYGVLLTGGWS